MKRLSEFVDKACIKSGSPDQLVSLVTCDSRQVTPHSLFVAVTGNNTDGHNFILDALHRGASVIVHSTDNDSVRELYNKFPEVTFTAFEDTSYALAQIASKFYDNPSRYIGVIGITGTNGKTTTSHIIKSILDRANLKTGLIGTIHYVIGDDAYEASHTTPEAVVFQRLLREMLEKGCDYAISEVSSHALVQKRVDCTEIKVAVFTNLTRDHLDYHRDMEDYFLSKSRLFTDLLVSGGTAVINLDDSYGLRLIDMLKDRDVNIITYGIESEGADVKAKGIELSFRGLRFKVSMEGITEELTSSLCGITSVYNCLSACAVAKALNIPMQKIKEGIAMTKPVKGRFERVDLGQDFLAVVDYAHTEDALERLLLTARQLLNAYSIAQKTERMMREKDEQFGGCDSNKTGGKIITVFGCGGNRDRGKRIKMGEIASKLSDFVIVTSDNPRNEDPKEIIREIERGIRGDNYIVIPDRKVAISLAVELASKGDIVLVAGKGHEEYQEIRGQKRYFSDRKVLEEAIKKTISRPSFTDWAQFFKSRSKMQNAHC